MNLVKTSLFAAISQATTLIMGLVAVKVLAHSIGPEGVAIQGQFLNTTAMMSIFATGAIGQGVIKYLAEYTGEPEMQLRYIRKAFTITLFCSLVIGSISVLAADYFSGVTLKEVDLKPAYWLYGLFLPVISINLLFTYILNGLKKIKYLFTINIISSCVNLVVLILLVEWLGVLGVLITLNVVSIIVFTINIYLFNKYKWFPYRALKPVLDKEVGKKLLKYSSMSMLAGFGAPLIQLLIRDRLIERQGMQDAGLWQTITRISDFYLSFITSVLSVYFLPRLSELKQTLEIKREIYRTARVIFPLILIMSTVIWFCRDLIIMVLLTPEFTGVRELFHFQFLGDVFKVGGWLLSNILWAKAMTRKYIIVDGISLLQYLLISFLCIEYFGLIGATIGFCISYFIYFITMIVVNRKYLL